MLKKTRWSRFTGPVVIFLLLVFCLLPPTSAQDLAEFEKRLTRFTLDNGMTFLVLERHEAPVVSFVTHADVGAVNEVRGITGIAHLLEHMAFKGTKKVGTTGHVGEMWALAKLDAAYAALREELDKRVGEEDPERLTLLRERFKKAQEEASKLVVTNEFAEALNREGATSLNAGTSNDATMYMVSLPSNKLELWMSLESDRFMNPVLREFYKELEVVKEERRMRTESSPQGRLVEEFLAVAFKAHPYGDPVIGHMSDLEALSREKVETFFKAYYAPGNLTVAVVGDVDTEEVRRLAGIYFGRLQPGPKPEPIVTKEPPQNGERRVVLREKTQPSLFIGYHMPGVNHQDRPAFDILSDILGYGRTARLYKSLVKEKKMAANIWASGGFPGRKYPSLFIFSVNPTQGHSNLECEEVISAEIERLKTEPVTLRELEKARTRARAGVIHSLSSNMGMAFQLTFFEVLTGDWRNLFARLERYNRVTAEDIQRIVRDYFTIENRTLGVIETEETDS